MENIALTPNVVFKIANVIPVTSGHLAVLLLTSIIAIWGLITVRNLKLIPTGNQMLWEGLWNMFSREVQGSFTNKKLADKITPLILTFFIIILFSNIFGLYPLINSIILNSDTAKDATMKIFTTPTAHWSMTIALTLVILITSHLIGFYAHPLKYLGNYVRIGSIFKMKKFSDIGQVFLDLFLGTLDIIGELAKVISLSCRLFGNIVAGELMAVVIMGIASFSQFLIPIPFIILSLFSGIIQAVVFAFLSIQYISSAASSVIVDKE